jgi:hypothetical protein
MLRPPPARYFPVKPLPLRMEAGLVRFGTDFGNGAADGLFFQVDDRLARYLAAKRAVPQARHALLERDAAERSIHATVAGWLRATLAREHPERLAAADSGADGAPALFAVARAVQEDLVVLRRLPGGGTSAIGVHVSLPSGWRPERIHGASFGFIHGPVPDFAKHPEAERSMVAAMVERGPYVRFVWTVAPDDSLDHHPEEGRRGAWRADGPGFLRVERQVTVPFPDVAAALFLIRVYVYPFAALTPGERGTLARALAAMPDAIARYKGLDAVRDTVLAVLCGPGGRA